MSEPREWEDMFRARNIRSDPGEGLRTEITYMGDGVIGVTAQYGDDWSGRETKFFKLTEVQQTWEEVE